MSKAKATLLRATGWLGRKLLGRSAADIPTATLYFIAPMAGLITRPGGSGPIERLTPTLFASGGTAVILRYARAAELDILKARRFAKLLFLIDDDYWAIGSGDGLPSGYSQRQINYRDGDMAQALAMTTHVVSSSQLILNRLPHKPGLLLPPAQCHHLADLGHHDNAGRFEMVFSGTRGHLADFAFLAPMLAQFLRDHPQARLTTFLAGHVPPPLAGAANARHFRQMGWPAYQAFIASRRFHVALAPALDTPFNRARSLSRLHDHAGLGAASLFSRLPPFAEAVENGVHGLLADNAPEAWHAALTTMIADRAMTRRLAAEGRALSARLGSKARVRAFWLREFGLAVP